MKWASKNQSAGCLILFCLPFCAGGTIAFLAGVGNIIQGHAKDGAIMVLFGLVFAGVGFGLMTAAILGQRKAKRAAAIRAANPNEPWTWREEWKDGRIKSTMRAGVAGAWIFATLWNLISAPILFIVPGEVTTKHNPAALIGLLFPVVGAGLLVWAIRSTMRWRRFGESVFEMQTVPAPVGGALSGILRTGNRLEAWEGIHLTLSCIHAYVTGSGDDRSTHEDVLWQDDQHIRKNTDVPVFFLIPADARPTTLDGTDDRVLWRLEAKAKVPGIDYVAQFEVPVFATEVPLSAMKDIAASYREQETPQDFERTSKVRITRRGGGVEFYFPAARAKGSACFLTVFWLIWTAAIWFMIVKHAPIVFPIVFGLFEIIIFLFVLMLWFLTTRVTIDRGTVQIANRMFGAGSTKTFPAANVTEVTTQISGQTGNRPNYRLIMVANDGSRRAAGGMISNKHEAEWLAGEMTKQLTEP